MTPPCCAWLCAILTALAGTVVDGLWLPQVCGSRLSSRLSPFYTTCSLAGLLSFCAHAAPGPTPSHTQISHCPVHIFAQLAQLAAPSSPPRHHPPLIFLLLYFLFFFRQPLSPSQALPFRISPLACVSLACIALCIPHHISDPVPAARSSQSLPRATTTNKALHFSRPFFSRFLIPSKTPHSSNQTPCHPGSAVGSSFTPTSPCRPSRSPVLSAFLFLYSASRFFLVSLISPTLSLLPLCPCRTSSLPPCALLPWLPAYNNTPAWPGPRLYLPPLLFPVLSTSFPPCACHLPLSSH